MTSLSSGLHFISGLAVHLGVEPDLKSAKSSPRKSKRRRKSGDANYKPLSERQRKELLDSIRHDDFSE